MLANNVVLTDCQHYTYRMIICRMSSTVTITLYVKRNEAQPGGGPLIPADSGVKVHGAGRQLDLPTTKLCLCFKCRWLTSHVDSFHM